jgi:hypothetical protein
MDLTEEENPTEALKSKLEEEQIHDAIVRIQCTVKEDQNFDLNQLHESLESAQVVSGINVHAPEQDIIRRRTTLTEQSTLEEALSAYFDQQQTDEDSRDALLDKARQLQKELDERGGG